MLYANHSASSFNGSVICRTVRLESSDGEEERRQGTAHGCSGRHQLVQRSGFMEFTIGVVSTWSGDVGCGQPAVTSVSTQTRRLFSVRYGKYTDGFTEESVFSIYDSN